MAIDLPDRRVPAGMLPMVPAGLVMAWLHVRLTIDLDAALDAGHRDTSSVTVGVTLLA